MNYYNEFDPKAAAWIQELINQKLIPDGIVDTRSITDVRADELMEYRQCHFFAGIAGWSFALQLAGVDPDEPLWTGSCPCQPFSTAGKRGGVNDERHLWPVFYNLIKQCRPQKVIGEQVASSEIVGTELEASFIIAVQAGDFARANRISNKLVKSSALHYWKRLLDGVHADMAAIGYAFRPEVLGAHSVGAPHQRQRLYWGAERVSNTADNGHDASNQGTGRTDKSGEQGRMLESAGSSDALRLSDTTRGQCEQPLRTQGNVFQRSTDDLPDNRMAEISESVGRRGRSDGDSAGQGRQVQAPGLCTCGGVSAVAQGDGCGERLQGHRGFEQQSIPEERQREKRHDTETGGASHILLGNSASDNERRDTMPGIDGERLQTGRSSGDDSNAVANLPCEQAIAADKAGLHPESTSSSTSSVPWIRYALIYCRDNKIRRVPAESVLQRVVDGLSDSMDISRADRGFPLCKTASFEKGQIAVLLKGYGNSIVPQVAAQFIKAFNHKDRK